MVALKDTKSYTGSGRSPTSSLRDDSSSCSSVECSEVLTMGCVRRGREVGEWGGTARMKSRESIPLEERPGRPYIEFGGQVTYRGEGLLTECS